MDMIKKGLTIFLAILLLITACTPKLDAPAPEIPTSQENNESQESGNTVVTAESDLEYCKMIAKIFESQEKTLELQEKIITTKRDASKKKIEALKEKGESEDMVSEQQDFDDLNTRLEETKKELTQAKKLVADAATKCSKIAKKGDKTVCKEFKEDLAQRIKEAQDSLTNEKENLENIKKQYDAAKAAGKSSAFLTSIEEEKQQKNLEILKVNNNIDRLGQMSEELDQRCK